MDEHSDAGIRHESQCCCGRPQCAFLEHNKNTLEGLEKDLLSAAQIGQALLVRHETHMAEAEAERLRMDASMTRLEADKGELEAANARSIEENRDLLDQLEGLNNLVSESDTQIQCLTATLQSTRQELQRLTVLAGRTAALEAQLANLEIEQDQIRAELSSSEEGNRSAIQRWKRAEGTIGHLQEQIDRIEKEAREERERHVEVLGRMERRRAVEKELESAAGRLKGAAVVNSFVKYQNGSNVVSHFVKDILQDNANLQMGIVELREMLTGSNAEVENLREQLHLHQPLDEREANQSTLRAELSMAEHEVQQVPEVRPELHVHHHYHGPELPVKKSRKKRPVVTTGHFASFSGSSTPRAQRVRDWRSGTPSSAAAAIIAQTSVTVPPVNHQHRWSVQSTNSFTPSSVPSSPQRGSSIFDNIDNAFDSSRPTTPESSAPGSIPGSPIEAPRDMKVGRKSAYRSISTSGHSQMKWSAVPSGISNIKVGCDDRMEDFDDPNFSDNALPATVQARLSELRPSSGTAERAHTIPEEVEYEESETATESSYLEDLASRPQLLRRATSHGSLLSISGMDIHTLRDRPSQVFSGNGFSPRSPFSPAMASLSSSRPVMSPMTATVTPSFQRWTQDSGEYTRSLLGGQARNMFENKPTLGKRVGGWVWGKWGVAPTSSSENLRSKASESPIEAMLRSPGVNQRGPIKGLRPPKRAPSSVEPAQVNSDLLQEALAGPSIWRS